MIYTKYNNRTGCFTICNDSNHSNNITIYVGPGSLNSPFYEFYSDSSGTNKISSLNINNTYTFRRLNDATSHPFYISNLGYKQSSNNMITITGDGNSELGITGTQSFTVKFNNNFTTNDKLYYYCSSHTSMVNEFSLTQ